MPWVQVTGVPDWVPVDRLLGREPWTCTEGVWEAELSREAAADLQARLRGLGLGGQPLMVQARPPLKRTLVRRARSADAARRRNTTAGFRRSGARLDAEGRTSLTPESLAVDIGRQAAGWTVVDATCGAGGNAIGFARAGCQVVAIDVDAHRLQDAAHNAALYGVADQIRFVHGRAEDHLSLVDADLLFVDPPWGVDYDRSRTTIRDVPLLASVLAAAHAQPLPPRRLWAKVPPSFHAEGLEPLRIEPWFGRAAGDRQRIKFLLIRLPMPPRPPSS
ncbi:MAG: methyltransferase domain-containing protein [Myxococcales bacterium]|nr:methyltransferase domain-containing protein [Myxococcales bacterium]